MSPRVDPQPTNQKAGSAHELVLMPWTKSKVLVFPQCTRGLEAKGRSHFVYGNFFLRVLFPCIMFFFLRMLSK